MNSLGIFSQHFAFARCALLLAICWAGNVTASAASGRIHKVLPHYLDQAGRQSLSPSLYERDAYQAVLRRNPGRRSTLQFDVNWKARKVAGKELTLVLEARGTKTLNQPLRIETKVRPRRWFRQWTKLKIPIEEYSNFGELVAWRATLWHMGEQVSELKSFLWDNEEKEPRRVGS